MMNTIDLVRVKEPKSDRESIKANSELTHEVGVFINHRDVRVAIEELQEAGFSLDEITLIARRWRYGWLGDLVICDRFEAASFGSNETAQNFFNKMFHKGKYLLLLKGKANEMNCAGAIMSRRRGHADVWQF